MAKIVIAGSANCPYYAKIELLADNLAKNLPEFKLHKIVKQPYDWDKWLTSTCSEHGWSHEKSPIVWRELVDRGGKGMLIGGANEFQEYANGYYGVQSNFMSSDMRKIAGENLKTKEEIDDEERQFREKVTPVNVCVTSAGSPVSYSMMEALAKGEALGAETDVSVRLLDGEDNREAVEGLKMEVFDLACPLMRDITVSTDCAEAFKDCSLIVLLDEIERDPEESKDDWLKRNREHFVNYAKLINDNARRDVKVILAGRGPVNFNAFMILEHMPNIPAENVVAMSRLVENHAKSVIAGRLNVNSASVVDVMVWGHSVDKYFLDLSRSRVHNYDGAIWGPPSFSLPVGEMVHDERWLVGEYLEEVRQRGGAVEGALGHHSSAARAAAVTSLIRHWWCGGDGSEVFSLGVQSQGWYDIPEGLVCSVPVTFDPSGQWAVVTDLELSDDKKEKINEAVQDLLAEKYVIYPPPHVPTPEPSPTPPTLPTEEDGPEQGAGAVSAEGEEGDSLGRITEDREGEEQAESELNVSSPPATSPAATSPRSQQDDSTGAT